MSDERDAVERWTFERSTDSTAHLRYYLRDDCVTLMAEVVDEDTARKIVDAVNEHAALVRVAEAADAYAKGYTHHRAKALRDALDAWKQTKE